MYIAHKGKIGHLHTENKQKHYVVFVKTKELKTEFNVFHVSGKLYFQNMIKNNFDYKKQKRKSLFNSSWI